MTVRNPGTGISKPRHRRLADRLGMGLSLIAGLAILVTAACAPTAPGARSGESAAAPSTGSKLLQVGITIDAEPREMGLAFGNISAGASEPRFMVHSPLTIYDNQAILQPRLVERIPSVENGEWKILPDGKMELTWKLRPSVRWHDGTPFEAGDVVLGFKIANDPKLALGTSVLRQISEVAAPDPQTLVVGWRNVFISANDMGLNTLVPIPRHTVATLYDAGDELALTSSPLWGDQWIGLGPYKMVKWDRGSFIELTANDDYFLGRPKIDRVLIRYYGDSRSLIVGTLADDVDVVPVGSMKTEEAHVLKTQWESAGKGNVVMSFNKLRNGDFSFRDPNAPWMDPRARMAMTLMIDRPNMVETLHNGLSDVDDIYFLREDPVYQLAKQKGLPDLSYSPTRAHQMLAQAGYTRGADGLYRSPSGVPFRLEVSATADINTNVQELLILSDIWKQAGIESEHVMITAAVDKDAVRGQLKGVVLTSETLGLRSFDVRATSEISSEATRWRGANTVGHTNPVYDDLHKKVFSTVNHSERNQIAADMVKMMLDNMLYMPLTYSADVSANRTQVKGVTSVVPAQRLNAWNVHLWDMN